MHHRKFPNKAIRQETVPRLPKRQKRVYFTSVTAKLSLRHQLTIDNDSQKLSYVLESLNSLPSLIMSPGPALSIATDEFVLRNRAAAERVSQAQESVSPDTPPYSPLTPVLASKHVSGLNEALHQQNAPPDNQPQPEPQPQQRQDQPRQTKPLLPFSESDSPDAIALRSALSILHIQRQNTLRDLKTLERQKQIAKADPEAFAADLIAGRVKTVRSSGGLGIIAPQPRKEYTPAKEEEEDDTDNLAAVSYNRQKQQQKQEQQSLQHSADDSQQQQRQRSKFEDMPGPQNVIRAPPINWAKYHIVGEPLDRLHEEQQTRPSPGQPRRDGDESIRPGLGSKHVIAAPYSPWTDRLSASEGQGNRTRSVSRK